MYQRYERYYVWYLCTYVPFQEHHDRLYQTGPAPKLVSHSQDKEERMRCGGKECVVAIDCCHAVVPTRAGHWAGRWMTCA